MGRPRWSFGMRAVVATALVFTASTWSASTGAEPGESHPARIQAGPCTASGEVLWPLSDISAEFLVDGIPSAGDTALGSGADATLEASTTTLPVALTELVAQAASLVVDSADAATPIACADVGGRTLAGSELPIALVPVGGSGYRGVAVLRDLGDGRTSVAVYLISDPPGPSAATTQSAEVGSSVYFSGFDITVEAAKVDGLTRTLEISATFENHGTGTADLTSLQLNGHPAVLHGTDTIPLRVQGVAAPPGAVTRATLTSGPLPEGFSLDGATLVFGQADQHQASVELVPGGIAVSEAPQTVRLPRKARNASLKGLARFTISKAQLVAAGCTGRRDAVVFTPAPASELSLVLTVTVQGRARLGALVNTIATAPDGTSGVGGPGVLAIIRGDTARDLLYCYTVPAPGPGRYSVRFEAGDRRATIRFRVPSPP